MSLNNEEKQTETIMGTESWMRNSDISLFIRFDISTGIYERKTMHIAYAESIRGTLRLCRLFLLADNLI